MEKNKITNNEDIHVKVDQNNLIYIDPNSTINSDGEISPRNIQAEKLVMYVNLEADLVPRSILVSDNNTNTLTYLAGGTLNFLKNGDGEDYDTKWTDSFLNTQQKKDKNGNPTGEFFQSDKTGQTFGIDNITISIKGFNAVPTINITFIDVRGKTLFESPQNSPYKAFFHIPWPIFYLTVKGFYGKAIRYRLHLVKFTSKFNESTGNFEINTSFVGSTYAYLSDIPLQGILTAPYLFPNEWNEVTSVNTKTGEQIETIKKSSRGYELLKTVYSEYKLKGLIPPDFPVKTLKEVLTISTTLDTLLERQIFDQVVDMRIFAGLKQFDEDINAFESGIIGWGKKYLETVPEPSLTTSNPNNPSTPTLYFNVIATPKDSRKDIDGDGEGKFEHLIKFYGDKIKQSQLLTDNIKDQPQLINTTTAQFSKHTIGVGSIKDYDHYINDKVSGKLGVSIQELLDDLHEIRKNFDQLRGKLQTDVEKKMNEIVKNKNNGFGFEPTIRNIFAVILSNAEVLIRLMKDVHKKAFDVAETRKKVVSDFSKETDGDSIYPWPELKATVNKKENTIIYPGDPDFQAKLGSDNSKLWPEVAFLESYISITTNKVDPSAEKEGGINKIPNMTQNDVDISKIKKISTANSVTNILPYINKTPDSFLYEIYERAFNYTLIDSFSIKTIKDFVDLEYNNIFENVKGENGLRKILSQKVRTKATLITELEKLSPFEKYSYYKDSLPTTDYLRAFYEQSFNIEQYQPSSYQDDKHLYSFLDTELDQKVPDNYRKYIYPFSSKTYLNYLNGISGITSFDNSLIDCRNFLEVNTTQGLISGQIQPKFWGKTVTTITGNSINLFSQQFNINTTSTNILNTPFFHRQLFSDFNTIGSYGKYVGSAYLLLNSLAFTDLDEIKTGLTQNTKKLYKVLPSSLFRETGSSQYIPYHLMLKWGSIYHRHKKFLKEGIDIIEDRYVNNQITKEGAITPILYQTNKLNGETFFDNGQQFVYSPNLVDYISYYDNIIQDPFGSIGDMLVITGQIDLGIHPYYDNIFYDIVNGVGYYNSSTSLNTNFNNFYNTVNNNILNLKKDVVAYTGGTHYFWTQYVDDNKISNTKNTFTLLPSAGGNLFIGQKLSPSNPKEKSFTNNSFSIEEQNNFRIVWDDDLLNDSFENQQFSNPLEYNKSISNVYGVSNNYKKTMDLMSTFSPTILDEFEKYFLLFASEKVNLSVSDKPFNEIVYDKFQDLLKEIVTVDKLSTDTTDPSTQIKKLKEGQKTKLQKISDNILSSSNLIKITIGNPKEFNPHTLIGFIGKDKNNTFNYNSYKGNFDEALSTLYLGSQPENKTGSPRGVYEDFFYDNNVEFNEENLQIFRFLIYIYAGYKDSPNYITTPNFKDYLYNNIINNTEGLNNKLDLFLQELTKKFVNFKIEEDPAKIEFFDGYNNKPLKVELYNFFKSMNDKWIAGNSIGQRSLLEEFLFLDRANKDIGNDYYFDITRLTNIGDPKNIKQSLYGALSILLQSTGFDMRALPAYINFYGTNFSSTPKLVPSKKIAQNIFGTFLDVDYQEASPKIVIQYVGKSSTRPDIGKQGKYKFTDDSFNIGNVNNNPLLNALPKVLKTGDLAKSNKVVAFEVSFGDQNQSIFKGVTLDQATIKNTSDSFYVLENLARSESGASSYNVDIGLFDYYRQAAYTCDVTCMGNAMIQPTMYFYLKNIPMFKGTYWISEVTHSIKGGSMNTTFKGSRVPYTALPDLTDSFMSSYRTLFGKLESKALNRVNGNDKVTSTSKVIRTENGEQYTVDPGTLGPNEEVTSVASYTIAGIPFNGYKGSRYISQITYKNSPTNDTKWLRAKVALMGEQNYPINPSVVMSVISNDNSIITNPSFTWFEAFKKSDSYEFYATKFLFDKVSASKKLTKMNSTFLNPNTNKIVIVNSYYQLDTQYPITGFQVQLISLEMKKTMELHYQLS